MKYYPRLIVGKKFKWGLGWNVVEASKPGKMSKTDKAILGPMPENEARRIARVKSKPL